ncbi:Ff.00g118040.m01.CDS01 [Fusarium sp. VM40]|nr:Ff.00g118040.m01.CDS01 [Fusarium sp. VM40]
MHNFKVETDDPHEFTMKVGGHRVTVPYLSPEEKRRAKQEGPVTSIPDSVDIDALYEDIVEASAQYLTTMNEMNEQHGGGPDQVPNFTPALTLARNQGLAPVPARAPAWDPALARAQAPALAPAPVPTYQMGGISANRMPSGNQRHGAPGFVVRFLNALTMGLPLASVPSMVVSSGDVLQIRILLLGVQWKSVLPMGIIPMGIRPSGVRLLAVLPRGLL